jgi:hypothetical protein
MRRTARERLKTMFRREEPSDGEFTRQLNRIRLLTERLSEVLNRAREHRQLAERVQRQIAASSARMKPVR